MPRTSLTPQSALGAYAGLLTLTLTAADVANGNQFALGVRDILVAFNSHASTTYTVTITSVADNRGRTGDISAVNIVAQEIKIFGPMELEGWRQTDGNLYIAANNASVKFGIIRQ